jgi:hypothetical protein
VPPLRVAEDLVDVRPLGRVGDRVAEVVGDLAGESDGADADVELRHGAVPPVRPNGTPSPVHRDRGQLFLRVPAGTHLECP